MKRAILFLCCVFSTVANAQTISMVVSGPSILMASGSGKIKRMKVSPSVQVGGTYQFNATCQFTTNGVVSVAPCPTLNWATASAGNSTISPTGLLTAIAPGTASVTASSGSVISNAVAVTITPVPVAPTLTSIRLTANSTLPLNKTEYLSVTCLYSDGSSKPCAITSWNELAAVTGKNSLSWSISLNAYGMLTGIHAHGQDQFTASQGNITSNTVTVSVP
jgi:hypothetical protein